MFGRKKNKPNDYFSNTMFNMNRTFSYYMNRLIELAISSFIWDGIPEEIDKRFLEMYLLQDNHMIFFRDEIIGYLCLQVMLDGEWDVYNNPIQRTAYSTSGYQRRLNRDNSVLIYNNLSRTNMLGDLYLFAARLANMDLTFDINMNGQKTPLLLLAPEKKRLSIKNLFLKYDGNTPVIYGDESLGTQPIQSINTNVEFKADKIYNAKINVWNEAMTYLGITSISLQKRERLISSEVTAQMGGAIASRMGRLKAREQAAEQINSMFGLNLSVAFNDELDTKFDEPPETFEQPNVNAEGSEI